MGDALALVVVELVVLDHLPGDPVLVHPDGA
jgi:hypothetical protein